jgi:hypothetical protein
MAGGANAPQFRTNFQLTIFDGPILQLAATLDALRLGRFLPKRHEHQRAELTYSVSQAHTTAEIRRSEFDSGIHFV